MKTVSENQSYRCPFFPLWKGHYSKRMPESTPSENAKRRHVVSSRVLLMRWEGRAFPLVKLVVSLQPHLSLIPTANYSPILARWPCSVSVISPRRELWHELVCLFICKRKRSELSCHPGGTVIHYQCPDSPTPATSSMHYVVRSHSKKRKDILSIGAAATFSSAEQM